MSRIGKLPVAVPAGVKVNIEGHLVKVEGPKGKLSYTIPSTVLVSLESDKLVVQRKAETGNSAADYGTTRALLNNMVTGVSTGWKRSLELHGVGFNARLQGQKLILAVGYSHDVEIEVPTSVKATVGKTTIDLESSDRAALGTLASKIRKVNPPEPYLGKGIKYSDEKVRRKAGKTGKK